MDNKDYIKKMLRNRGYTQTRVAKLLGVTLVSVNNVVTGKRKNPRIREVLALACGKSVAEIWPEQAKEEEK